jgi:hypothetical protein
VLMTIFSWNASARVCHPGTRTLMRDGGPGFFPPKKSGAVARRAPNVWGEREGLLYLEGGMTRWSASVAILLTSLPHFASAQNCEAVAAGPARTDCYIGLSRIYQGQSDVAAGTARVQSDAARYRQITGTEHPKHKSRHRQ